MRSRAGLNRGWRRGRYSSTSDTIRDLVRRDQESDAARRLLQAAIDEGLESPEIDAAMDDIIADARKRWAKGTSVSD